MQKATSAAQVEASPASAYRPQLSEDIEGARFLAESLRLAMRGADLQERDRSALEELVDQLSDRLEAIEQRADADAADRREDVRRRHADRTEKALFRSEFFDLEGDLRNAKNAANVLWRIIQDSFVKHGDRSPDGSQRHWFWEDGEVDALLYQCSHVESLTNEVLQRWEKGLKDALGKNGDAEPA